MAFVKLESHKLLVGYLGVIPPFGERHEFNFSVAFGRFRVHHPAASASLGYNGTQRHMCCLHSLCVRSLTGMHYPTLLMSS